MASPSSVIFDSAQAPSRAPYPLLPSDSLPLNPIPKRLYVGTAGDIVLRGVEGVTDVTYRNVGAGTYLDVSAGYVRATGTTAGNIIAEA